MNLEKLKNWHGPIKWTIVAKGYLAILGLTTFPLFISEEAVQVAQGGTWAAKAARDWDTMRAGCDLVDDTATALKAANRAVGWLNPWGYPAYRAYARNSHYYAAACRKQADAGQTGVDKRGRNGWP